MRERRGKREKRGDRQMDRQSNKQTDRQTQRQTNSRKKDRQRLSKEPFGREGLYIYQQTKRRGERREMG